MARLRRRRRARPPVGRRRRRTRPRSTGFAVTVSVYGCDCSRTTFETWAADHGRPLARPRLPGWLPIARPRRTRPPGRRWAAVPSAGWTSSSDRARRRSAPTATCRSSIATATGPTGSPSSWTTCARASTSSSAGRDLLAATADADPSRPPARTRDAGDLRASPARPTARRPEAVEGRRRHLGPRAARGGPVGRGR